MSRTLINRQIQNLTVYSRSNSIFSSVNHGSPSSKNERKNTVKNDSFLMVFYIK